MMMGVRVNKWGRSCVDDDDFVSANGEGGPASTMMWISCRRMGRSFCVEDDEDFQACVDDDGGSCQRMERERAALRVSKMIRYQRIERSCVEAEDFVACVDNNKQQRMRINISATTTISNK